MPSAEDCSRMVLCDTSMSQTPLGERVPSAMEEKNFLVPTKTSQTPLGERVPSALTPLWGYVFGVKSQTPLGERVPSAVIAAIHWASQFPKSQTPLGERVPSAKNLLPSSWQPEASSQTPLGERVPSAESFKDNHCGPPSGLKPLSGNVCLRPRSLGLPREASSCVSNPSRGTCAFGPRTRDKRGSRREQSQTPLGERVPSAIC